MGFYITFTDTDTVDGIVTVATNLVYDSAATLIYNVAVTIIYMIAATLIYNYCGSYYICFGICIY